MNKYYQLFEGEDISELYIFGDIVDEAWCENDVVGSSLCQEIKELNTKQINVYINSYGGSVASGLGIYNQLKMHPAKVTTYCQGFACSISSVIFMAGDERIMSNASLLMIHNAWTSVCGNAKELRKQADDLEKITQASINAYMEHINIEEEQLIELLDNESWLTADECLEMGFATNVVNEESEAAASQSVKQSLIDMIKQACKDDEDDEKQAEDNKDDEKDEDNIEDEDIEDDEAQDEDEQNEDEEDEDEENEDEKKQGTELKAMSSFLNLFK